MQKSAFLTIVAATAAAGLMAVAGPAVAATSTTRVDETSIGNGWTLYADNGATGAFVDGPSTPPAPTGSFEFTIPNGGKVTLKTDTVAGQPLSGVDTVGYSTYRSSTSTMPGNVARR